MLGIDLKDVGDLTEEEISKELLILLPSAVVRANRNAINRTATGVRTFSSKAAREELNLKSKTVKESLGIKKAGRGANPVGKFDVLPKSLSLKRYKARTTRKGVTVKVKKSNGRKVVKGGFIQESLGGHVFKRVGEDRYPIKKLWGPSVRVELEDERDEIKEYIDGTYKKRFREQARYEIYKARGRR